MTALDAASGDRASKHRQCTVKLGGYWNSVGSKYNEHVSHLCSAFLACLIGFQMSYFTLKLLFLTPYLLFINAQAANMVSYISTRRKHVHAFHTFNLHNTGGIMEINAFTDTKIELNALNPLPNMYMHISIQQLYVLSCMLWRFIL